MSKTNARVEIVRVFEDGDYVFALLDISKGPMVVEMGPEVRAWATYPGGQSGNPMSSFYDNRIEGWSRGELEEILFPRVEADLPAERIIATMRTENR